MTTLTPRKAKILAAMKTILYFLGPSANELNMYCDEWIEAATRLRDTVEMRTQRSRKPRSKR